MTTANLIPAETKVVEISPAKITWELTLQEAAVIKGMLGNVSGGSPYALLAGFLFSQLRDAVPEALFRPVYDSIGNAIRFKS